MNLGPAAALVCWQAVVLACVVSGACAGTKRTLDGVLGRDRRRANRWLTHLVLPALPIVLGVLGAICTPLRSEWLEVYAQKFPRQAWQVHGAWGFMVGLFADYGYQQVKRLLELRGSGQRETVAPVPVVHPSSNGESGR